jgi:THO complex subunit 5
MTTTEPHINDPVLLSVLSAASTARAQSLELLDIIAANSRNSSQETEDAVADSSRKLTARLAQLRGLNRKAIVGVRNTKQETTEARQEIDALHLVLQNLYYEQRHLRGEIRGCEGFEYDSASMAD